MEKKTNSNFHDVLKYKINEYIHFIYGLTKKFPKEEMYGVTSQIRRAVISIMLNYIEGFARMRGKVYKNFAEISYGSLKESCYLVEFSFEENYISKEEYNKAIGMADEIGAMLYSTLKNLK